LKKNTPVSSFTFKTHMLMKGKEKEKERGWGKKGKEMGKSGDFCTWECSNIKLIKRVEKTRRNTENTQEGRERKRRKGERKKGGEKKRRVHLSFCHTNKSRRSTLWGGRKSWKSAKYRNTHGLPFKAFGKRDQMEGSERGECIERLFLA